mgnify:CR=1 FL=1
MKWIIDRFEEDYAVVECNGVYFNVPKTTLPQGASEGDVLKISVSKDDTESRKAKADKLLDELFGE